jgi:hypothetical protein
MKPRKMIRKSKISNSKVEIKRVLIRIQVQTKNKKSLKLYLIQALKRENYLRLSLKTTKKTKMKFQRKKSLRERGKRKTRKKSIKKIKIERRVTVKAQRSIKSPRMV